MTKEPRRNDPCPCGSGKKFKNCHWALAEKQSNPENSKGLVSLTFNELLISNNSVQLLSLLGALQLHPENHGRNIRFEKMCLATLRQFNPSDEKPSASWSHLKYAIENFSAGAMSEDPASNAFTENVMFEEGNYTVYPGIYEGFSGVLNQLIECIFLRANDLDSSFIKEVRDAIGLMLHMTDQVASIAGHIPYIFQPGITNNIEFADEEKTYKCIKSLYFQKPYLNEVCKKLNYDIGVLSDFIIEPGSDEINEEDPEKNVVNFRPLIEVKDAILLYMPTGIINALITFIYRKAKQYSSYNDLLKLLYNVQFNNSCVSLQNTGWVGTDIELPLSDAQLPIKEAVFQIDNQKFGYVCFLKTGEVLSSSDTEKPGSESSEDSYQKRTNEVIQYLRTLNEGQTFGVFCLYIIAETANNFFFKWNKPGGGNYSLTLKYRELWVINHSEKIDNLTLWKFAKCYSRTHESMQILAFGGVLDTYAVYAENHGSLFNSDLARPTGGILLIEIGSSDELKREVQKNTNEHVILIFHERRIAFAKVKRFRNYAPIYEIENTGDHYRIVIESYKMPVWIITKQAKHDEENMATWVCEAIAFWLNKMESFLTPYINELRFVQFEIEVSVAEELLSDDLFEIKAVSVEDIKLDIKVVVPRISITVPAKYQYAVMRPDNIADKMLMKAVLQGVISYIQSAGGKTELNDNIIDKIIIETLQPSNAKMLLLSDASSNIKMDGRNLPPMRYINSSTISYILDDLVSYLPKSYIIPVNIPDEKGKIHLCDSIVAAVIEQLTIKIAAFDGIGLLKWLVKMNEKCIQLREVREIHIPAKIACFSAFQIEVDKLMDDDQNLIITAHSIRTLTEFVASKIPTGLKWPNYDDIDELLALTNQLTEWGALSEAIRMGIDNPQMGLLPSGRIGSDKSLANEFFKPYSIAKTESILFRNIENFDRNYVPERKGGNTKSTEETEALDIAFKAEFGIPLTLLSHIIGSLVNEGFTKAIPFIEIEEPELRSLLFKIDKITEVEINIALELLTLLERENIGEPPQGYTSKDIFPWRYNRPISFIRRPLIKVIQDRKVFYCFGYRHLMQFIDNLIYLLFSSKLPDPKSSEMKSWLAENSNSKGSPFRGDVKKWFEDNSPYEIFPHEVEMDKGVSKANIETDKHYGDIDLLVIDHEGKIIYPIECKNIQGGRNIHEIKVEMDDYLGREGKDKKAKIRKHVARDQWLQANKKFLAHLVADPETYKIKSFILTADEISLSYLKKGDLPLPIKSFTFLRKNGLLYLADL